MKYIKKYEMFDGEPKIGDYIIFQDIYDEYTLEEDIKCIQFLSTHIGKIIDMRQVVDGFLYHVQYDNIPKDIQHLFALPKTSFTLNPDTLSFNSITIEDIKYFSPNKKDLEMYIMADKYNL